MTGNSTFCATSKDEKEWTVVEGSERGHDCCFDYSVLSGEAVICEISGNLEAAVLISAAKELLQVAKLEDMIPVTNLKEERNLIAYAREVGWKDDMPVSDFIRHKRRYAIAKAKGEVYEI